MGLLSRLQPRTDPDEPRPARPEEAFWRQVRQQPCGIPYESLDWVTYGGAPAGLQWFVPETDERLTARHFQGPG
jgi:hypothetical protein